MSREVEVRQANQSDNAALIELTLACPMMGDIGVCMDRSPDFFTLNALEGEEWRVGVALSDEGRVAGSVAVARREVWLDGQPRTIAYVGDLKVHPKYRNKRYADALSHYAARTSADLCGQDALMLCTILGGNASMEARVSGPRSLPTLRKFATTRAHTISLLWMRRPPKVEGLRVRRAEESDLAAMTELWSRVALETQFAFTFRRESLGDWIKRAPALSLSDYWVAYGASGRLEGFMAFWDQDSFKHMRITRYSKSLGRMRSVFNLVGPMFGATKLPAEGQILRYLTGVNVCVPSGRPEVLRALAVAAYNDLRGKNYSFISLPLDANDPLANGLDGLMSQPTEIHAYVTGPGGRYVGPEFEARRFHNEIALV
jgi:hypothetical protein